MNQFDQIINRRNTNCYKWDSLIRKYGQDNDIIPMGVADMDFAVSPAIEQALVNRASTHIYGYTDDPMKQLGELIVDRYNKRGYGISQDDIVLATGVIHAINNVILQFTRKGDGIILPEPYYTPFMHLIEDNERVIVPLKMEIVNGRYTMNLSNVEPLVNERTKMFILCNPHNPTGRILDHDELVQLAQFAQKHQLMIIDDEIHSDFTLNKPFETVLNISEYTRNNTFVFLSATKTFNMAGLKLSFCFICNPEYRQRYLKQAANTGLTSVNCFAIDATAAAYGQSQKWEQELVSYLKNNCRYAVDFINKHLPQVKVQPNEGTYLLWLDMRDCGIEADRLNEYLIKAGVQLNDGKMYGKDYAGFQRMNCALPFELLQSALNRIEKALQGK